MRFHRPQIDFVTAGSTVHLDAMLWDSGVVTGQSVVMSIERTRDATYFNGGDFVGSYQTVAMAERTGDADKEGVYRYTFAVPDVVGSGAETYDWSVKHVTPDGITLYVKGRINVTAGTPSVFVVSSQVQAVKPAFRVIQRFAMVPTPIDPSFPAVFQDVSYDSTVLNGGVEWPLQNFTLPQMSIPNAPQSAGTVVLTCTSVGNWFAPSAVAKLAINSVPVSANGIPIEFFDTDGADCPTFNKSVRTMSANAWNAKLDDRNPMLVGVFLTGVDAIGCTAGTYIRLEIAYTTKIKDAVFKPKYIGWASYGNTLVGGRGDPRRLRAKWVADRQRGMMLVRHTDDSFRATFSGAAVAPIDAAGNVPDAGPVLAQYPPRACLMSIATGEVPGTVVIFTTSGKCVVI